MYLEDTPYSNKKEINQMSLEYTTIEQSAEFKGALCPSI
jgi:hypothetical protein